MPEEYVLTGGGANGVQMIGVHDQWEAFSSTIAATTRAMGAFDSGEALDHLVQQVVCWLTWCVRHADPAQPRFHRQNDLVVQWGGPNADNVYRHARVAPGNRYRIRGHMHSCETFILAFRAGFMHDETWGTLHEITARELGIGEDESFEIMVGGEGGLAIPPGTAMVTIREYYFDWRPREPAVFTIECLAGEPQPADPAGQLERAATAVTRSLTTWAEYLAGHRAAQNDNAFGPVQRIAKGLDAAAYCFCFWNLDADDVLLIESDVPAAPYWSVQLATEPWFAPFDFSGPITSLNHRQAVIDTDGRVRIAAGARDPGAPNWLDTRGRTHGLLTFRWFWAESDAAPRANVVPYQSVATTAVTPETRAEQMAARAAHIAWRFRS